MANFGRQKEKQQGFTAIFTVLIVMAVLSLVALGFTNIVNEAQLRTLDDQLSVQALYAAETGVNRAQTLLNTDALAANKTDCLNDPATFDYDINAAAGVSISCLLVERTPYEVRGSSVGLDDQFIMPLDPVGAGTPDRVTISWDVERGLDDNHNNTALVPNGAVTANNPQLMPADQWGSDMSVLRVDLVRYPTSDTTGSSLGRAATIEDGYTFFLYPTGGAGSANPFQLFSRPRPQGQVIEVHCADTAGADEYRCSHTVRLRGVGAGADRYYLRLTSYYHPSTFEISSANSSNARQRLEGAQAVIDSTGRVSGVSRRIQVRVPIWRVGNRFNGLVTPYSIFSGESICKRIVATPYVVSGGNTYQSTIDSSDFVGSQPACALGD